MTTKSDFTEEEWIRVRRAPFVAGMAISLADPGGPIELAKESTASLKSATNPPTREQLLAEIALDVQAMIQHRQNPLSGFKPTNAATAGQQILGELQAVSAIVSSKATADEYMPLSNGCSRPRRPPQMRPRRAASWASMRYRSVKARTPCWTRCVPRSTHNHDQDRSPDHRRTPSRRNVSEHCRADRGDR
jgi:hypothetical protein